MNDGHPISQPYSRAGLLAKLTGAAVLAVGSFLVGQGTSQLASTGSGLTWASSALSGTGGSTPGAQSATAWSLSNGTARLGTSLVVDGTAAGSITTTGGVTASSGLFVNGTSGAIKSFCQIQRGGLTAWFMSVRDATDDLRFRAYDDAGAAIDYPLTIARAAGGAITLTRPLTATTITASGNVAIAQSAATLGVTARLRVDAPNSNTGPALAIVADSVGRGFGLYGAGYVDGASGSAMVINTTATGAAWYVFTTGNTVAGVLALPQSAVIGTTGLLGSERFRANGGGSMPSLGATDVVITAGKVGVGDTSATSIQSAGGATLRGLTSTVAGISATFDSGTTSDSRMEFKRNGVRMGLFSWDTATLRFEGDTSAASWVYFKAAGADRLTISGATGQVSVPTTTASTSVATGAFTVGGGIGVVGRLNVGSYITALIDDAGTANAATSFILAHTTSGTPGAGFGTQFLMDAESSTTVGRSQALIAATWVDATDATRKARIAFNVYDTAAREGFRCEADGTNPMVGFLGAAAVVRQTIGAAATDPATTQTLTNNIRTALINLGLCAA